MLIAVAVFLGLLLLSIHQSSCPTDSSQLYLSVKSVTADLKNALDCYETDFHRFPIQENGKSAEDVVTRSRGILLQVLQGENISMLNPREVRYIDLPQARNHKNGLWQDGEEWVLSDRWGEPYYIALDTNNDMQVPNPEFGEISADPKRAEFDQKHPQPKMLQVITAIYSSGPDRDPKTWSDNVCSWRPH
ncbi:MAG: hypothetical protein J0L73_26370 [Verrucomicrobia bacterium]|nr:hypothetical protein [Verrucomicrobiota bacterium]